MPSSGAFRGNPGASNAVIAAAERALGVQLPEAYKNFLREHDGGVGVLGQDYVDLWSAGDLSERQSGYEVSTYAPGLLLFGSDGGGEAFAFDTRAEPWAVVRAPFVGMSLDDCVPVARTFDEFLRERR